jgi:hypothetical protein
MFFGGETDENKDKNGGALCCPFYGVWLGMLT